MNGRALRRIAGCRAPSTPTRSSRYANAILALDDDRDRARLAGLFGHMTAPQRNLGSLRGILRDIAALPDDDLDRLAQWFSTWVNTWGQTPRASGLRIDPHARRDPAEQSQ